MDTEGRATIVSAFTPGPAGLSPYGPLVESADGSLYGTTLYGGFYDRGTVFKLSRDGDHRILHSFVGDSANGAVPTALILAADGNFYGTTATGGAFNQGTAFRMALDGDVTVLHHFTGGDGGGSPAGLTLGADGNFYGVTASGGVLGYRGTAFRMTPAGVVTVLHHFAGYPSDGQRPDAPMVQAPDGNFYGTTSQGGAGGCCGFGTIFKMTPDGRVTILRSLDASDGDYSGYGVDGLTLGRDGKSVRDDQSEPKDQLAVPVPHLQNHSRWRLHAASRDHEGLTGGRARRSDRRQFLWSDDGLSRGGRIHLPDHSGRCLRGPPSARCAPDRQPDPGERWPSLWKSHEHRAPERGAVPTSSLARAAGHTHGGNRGLRARDERPGRDRLRVGRVGCSARYAAGAGVQLTATPAPEWTFAGWRGDPDCIDGFVELTTARACRAMFRSISAPRPVGDFDGDGRSDLLWRHDGGPVAIWLMDGAQALGGSEQAGRHGLADRRQRRSQRR